MKKEELLKKREKYANLLQYIESNSKKGNFEITLSEEEVSLLCDALHYFKTMLDHQKSDEEVYKNTLITYFCINPEVDENTLVLEGRLSVEQAKELLNYTKEGYFYPNLIGLPCKDSTALCEYRFSRILFTDQLANTKMSADEFLENFKQASVSSLETLDSERER